MSEELNNEWGMMFEESEKVKVLDSGTFKKPVKNIKVRKPIVLKRGSSAKEAVELMREQQRSAILVVESDGKLAGIVTERDVLLKVIGSEKDLSKITIDEIMTPDPEAFQKDDSVGFVLNAMHVGGYRNVPIVDEQGHPIAVVAMRDIVGFIVEHFPEEVLNLPPKPIRRTDQREGA